MKRVKGQKLRMAHWSDPLYAVSIVLMCGDWLPAEAWLRKTLPDEDEFGPPGTGARTLWTKSAGMLTLWFPSSFTVSDVTSLGNLAHECFHAATMVLGSRGLRLSDKSDEAYAYYIAWLFRECYQRLKLRGSA